jgi:uncharacterized membrane protein
MSETTQNHIEKAGWLPRLRSRWWTALLGLSLMLNLLVGGGALGGWWSGRHAERLAGASYVQLIPRNFFRDLPGERRNALMQIVRDNRDDLRNLRQAYESSSLKLADVLEKEAFSMDEVKATVTAFSTGTESLAAKGGDVVINIVSQLTPEERKLLASAIRERGNRGGRGRKRD